MKLILNIGLDVNATQTLAANVALQIVAANDFRVERHAVVQSDTEPTLVVEVTFDPFFTAKGASATVGQAVYRTAKELRQDCIAVYNPSKPLGALVGPHAAKWGPFNPELFFLLDGTRLAQPAAKAA